MNNYKNTIKSIREKIYEYNIKNALNDTVLLIESLNLQLSDNNRLKYNEIVKYIVLSMENKDYELLSDILKFELEPFLDMQLM